MIHMPVELYIDLENKEYSLTIGDNRGIIPNKEIIFELFKLDIVTQVRMLGYKAVPELFMSIIKEMLYCTSITYVDVSSNELCKNGVKVAHVLSKSPSICTINFKNNWLEANDAKKIIKEFKKQPADIKKVIDLKDNLLEGIKESVLCDKTDTLHYSEERCLEGLKELELFPENIELNHQKENIDHLLGLISAFAAEGLDI